MGRHAVLNWIEFNVAVAGERIALPALSMT
jgi:hypothetical protein